MMLLKHPDTGLYYMESHIIAYANLTDPEMEPGEAIDELEREGFERVWPESIEGGNLALLAALLGVGADIAEGIGRMAENMGRTATSLEAFARQAPLMTPPIGVERVAELAQVAAKTVYRWKGEGLLKPLADNKPLLFDQAEVHDFIRRRRQRGK